MKIEFQRGKFGSSHKVWGLAFNLYVWIPEKKPIGSVPFTIKQRGIKFSLSLPWSKK
jgi:hypothetical protein